MAVADYTDSASTLSDGSGSFTTGAGGYYNGAFSTASVQFTHSSGNIQRSGAGWGSCAWNTQFGPDAIVGVRIAALGEFELELRGKDMASSNWDAYGLYYDNASGWEMYRTINSTNSTLTTATQSLAVSDTFAFVAIGSGASVSLAGAINWGSDFISTTDSTSLRLTNSGYVGIWANGTTPKFDVFYGGDAVASGGGSTVSMSAAVAAVSAFTASQMVSTRGVSATVAAVSQMAATGMVSSKQLAAAIAAVSSFSGTTMVSQKQLQAAISAVSAMSATTLEIGGQVSLEAVVAATSAMAASGMVSAKALAAGVAATSAFMASGMASTYRLSADVQAVSSVIASTLAGIATGELTLTPISGGTLVLTAASDPGGLVLTPYSDPGGLTLTPVS